MDLLEQTKQLCNIYNIKPARSKGQNFLIKEDVYDRIIDAADLKSSDVVLEVGPGLGFLTSKLALKARKVIAIELDDKLAEVLKTGLISREVENVEVVNDNILELGIENFEFRINNKKNIQNSKFNPPAGRQNSFKIVANLPYNITSVFLRKFLSAENKPELVVLMLQKEVAERIVAKKGKMSLLAVSVQFYAEAEVIQTVPSNNFWPEPKVDSAIVRIEAKLLRFFGKNRRSLASLDEKEFFRLVKIGFSAKRKMLKNNLANGCHITREEAEQWLKKSGLSPKVRAQE
ncbi:MAG TPA: ribosomal RNA small subunit methyltransferase A, partial [Ignavibacteria bacterium]|nr:ribosomal RNA small subunit methyltransferase A [Ignavibacteria bacterium]